MAWQNLKGIAKWCFDVIDITCVYAFCIFKQIVLSVYIYILNAYVCLCVYAKGGRNKNKGKW